MKATVILLILACTIAMVYGDLVCGTHFCKKNTCVSPIVSSSCRAPAVYREKHAGKCACCPACVTFLKENVACSTYSKELGETPTAICEAPLVCLRGVCTKIKR